MQDSTSHQSDNRPPARMQDGTSPQLDNKPPAQMQDGTSHQRDNRPPARMQDGTSHQRDHRPPARMQEEDGTPLQSKPAPPSVQEPHRVTSAPTRRCRARLTAALLKNSAPRTSGGQKLPHWTAPGKKTRSRAQQTGYQPNLLSTRHHQLRIANRANGGATKPSGPSPSTSACMHSHAAGILSTRKARLLQARPNSCSKPGRASQID